MFLESDSTLAFAQVNKTPEQQSEDLLSPAGVVGDARDAPEYHAHWRT